MAFDDRTQATLRYRHGGTATQPVPFPLPEAVLEIAQVLPDRVWEPGSMRPEGKWGTRVFLLEREKGETPRYSEEEGQPEPTYENASFAWPHCSKCKTEAPLLFARTYPRDNSVEPKGVDFMCEVHYAATYRK